MTADDTNDFAYEPASEHTSAAARKHYWAVAIGLQAIDGLEVSPYLKQLSKDYENGFYDLAQTGDYIRAYHGIAANVGNSGTSVVGSSKSSKPIRSAAAAETADAHAETREADLVSQRIAELLAGAPFVLSPQIISQIHQWLFRDLDPSIYHPGEFKCERMIKQEDILNGDSVLYADPLAYESSLKMAFDAERARVYGLELKGEDLKSFCHTIAFIWQVHPFSEGNTRTVAVFSELYLNHLGFTVGNDPFEHNARYYRDALVRAMYRNAAARILPDSTFLIRFYDNVVNDAGYTLDREDLICAELFDHPELLRNVSPDEALRVGL